MHALALTLTLTVDMDELELEAAIEVASRVWGVKVINLHVERDAGWLVVLVGDVWQLDRYLYATYTGGDQDEVQRLLATAV